MLALILFGIEIKVPSMKRKRVAILNFRFGHLSALCNQIAHSKYCPSRLASAVRLNLLSRVPAPWLRGKWIRRGQELGGLDPTNLDPTNLDPTTDQPIGDQVAEFQHATGMQGCAKFCRPTANTVQATLSS